MDYDIAVPADDLGFLLPKPPIGGPPELLSSSDLEQNLIEAIRQKALVNVDFLSELLMERAVEPAASSKLIGDTLEANYKLSGLAAKNAAKEAATPPMQVSIVINGFKTVEAPVVQTIDVTPTS
jgi:hypothetical protein